MKQLLLYLTCQIITSHLFAQLDSADKSFVYTILKQEPFSDSIRYTDKLKPVTNIRVLDNFQHSEIVGYDLSTQKKVKIKLSKEENAQLQRELQGFYKVRWHDSLFVDSRMIPADSMWSFVSSQLKLAFSKNSKEKPDSSINYMSYSTVFQFSKPIFLRNRSFVIFYFLRLCASDCGVEDFSVYRMQNGQYKRWLSMGGGAF
jgi:hypothetical protein